MGRVLVWQLLPLAGTIATAVPLCALSTTGREAPGALVVVHVCFASVFFVLLAAKIVMLGERADPRRYGQAWEALVAHLTTGLAAYTLLTGVLLGFSVAWADQHLAASAWMLVAAAGHAHQASRRFARLTRSRGEGQAHSRGLR